MTTRHSLFTRSLSMLLAIVMVLSNMSGLTLQVRAADSMLFDILAESETASNATLNSILDNAAALPELAEKNIAVDYAEEPYEELIMINGLLDLEPIGEWTPAYYLTDAGEFPYEEPVQLEEDVEYLSAFYQRDLGVSDEISAIYSYVANVGAVAAQQRALLNDVSIPKSLTALSMLDVDFINDMFAEVDNLVLADMDDEEATDEDLANLKSEFKTTISEMLNCLVTSGNRYMEYLNRKGEPEYENYLIVYAILAEYDEQGLRHYYENKSYIDAELKAMSAVLDDLLGDKVDGVYENAAPIDAILDNMGYGDDVSASQLGTMAQRMRDAANGLPYLSVNVDLDSDLVDTLFFAKNQEDTPLICQFQSAGLDANLIQEVELLVFNEIVETEPTTEATEATTEETEPELGSEENPIWLELDEANTVPVSYIDIVELPAGKTVYAQGYVSGMNLEAVSFKTGASYMMPIEMYINGESMTADSWSNGAVYEIENLPTAGFRMPVVFKFVNNNDYDGFVNLEFTYPEGTMSNPAELEMGENTVELEEGTQGYYYEWTATGKGTLSITMNNDQWTYVINNMTTYAYGDTQWSDSDPVVNPGAVEVSRNDVIQLLVNTYDAANPWTAPAGTLSFTASFEEYVEPSEPEETEHTHTVVHVAAVAPSCYAEGNVEYWYCSECELVCTDEAMTLVSNHKSVILPAACQNVVYVEAKAASCYEEGNIEYWYCAECMQVWQDENLMQLTNIKNVVLPAACQDVIHVEAKAASCFENGNIEYWYCEVCGTHWQDENLMQITNRMNVIIPAQCAEVKHVEAVAPSCYTEGNMEYWYCAECMQVWQDENLLQLTNIKNVVLPAACQNVIHVEAVAPSCYEEGNIEYWYCADCMQVWQDENLMQLTNIKNVVLPATHNTIKHVDATTASCFAEGNIEYWYCEDCLTFWQDEAMLQITNSKNVITPATHNTIKHVEAVAPTCFTEGNIEHWYCEDCLTFWQDEAMLQITNSKNVILPAQCAEVKHVEAVAPSCYTEGNIEYWYCEECMQVWQDEDLLQLTNIKNVVLPAACQSVVHVDAVKATCYEDGNIEYWYCEDCLTVWQDENLMQLTNFKNVVVAAGCARVKHVMAVTPSCFTEGNIKYWYCADCERVWQDSARTQLTNFKNVILPAACQNVIHVEAKEATCFEDGNIEYWYCAECMQVWQDENLMQLTNIKNVVVPAAHAELIHVEGNEATCFEDGNIEHWYCPDCGYAWLDAEGIYNTNLKAVVLPAGHGELVHSEYKRATCKDPGNIQNWYCPDCDKYYLDEDCIIEVENVTIPATHMPSGIINFIKKLFTRSTEGEGTVCAVYDCADCDETEITVVAEIVEETVKENTCTENGLVEMVPTVTLNGATFTAKDTGDQEITLGDGTTVTATVEVDEDVVIEEVEIEAKGHEFEHFEAVAGGCHTDGNYEYWHCLDTSCDEYYLVNPEDDATAEPVAKEAVIIPATLPDVYLMGEYDPCTTDHWMCFECRNCWLDEELTQLVEDPSTLTAHNAEHVAESCYNAEYWYCDVCGMYWADANLIYNTNSRNVIKAVPEHAAVHVEAVAPSCYEDGNIEYWYCEDCLGVWVDAELTQVTNFKSVVDPAACQSVKHVEAKTPSCYAEGNIEYWYCADCMQVWQDENLMQLTNIKNVVLPAACQNVVHEEYLAPECHQVGIQEHWYCQDCLTVWADENLMQITNFKNIIIPELGGDVIHVEAKTPNCSEIGNIEYWYCEECNQYWADEARTQLTNKFNVILPMQCTNIVHIEAVEPGCHYIGNVEYWYCADCGTVWTDEDLRYISNMKSVLLPEKDVDGEQVIHVEAKEPTAYEEGNIEYWHCEECEQVWTDEARTQLSNSKNVLIPSIYDYANGSVDVWFEWNEDYNYGSFTTTLGRGVWTMNLWRTSEIILTVNGEEVEYTAGMGFWSPATYVIVNDGYEDVEYTLEATYPVGHRNNPEQVWRPAYIPVTVPAGNTQGYYLSYTNYWTVGTLAISVGDVYEGEVDDVILLNQTTWQQAWLSDDEYGDGTVRVDMMPGDEILIQVNAYWGDNWDWPGAELYLTGQIIYPIGHSENPDTLVIGENIANIKEGNNQGYWYNYTATGNNTLVLELPAEGGWQYVINNLGDPDNWSDDQYGETVTSEDGKGNIAYAIVSKGDNLQIMVSTYDAENPWTAPAGQITVKASTANRGIYRFYGLSNTAWSSKVYNVGYIMTAQEAGVHADAIEKSLESYNTNNSTKWIFDREAFIAKWTTTNLPTDKNIQIDFQLPVTVNGEEVNVDADKNAVTSLEKLGFITEDNFEGRYEIVVNGKTMYIDVDAEGAESEKIVLNAAGENTVEFKGFVSKNRLVWQHLADILTEAGAGTYKVVEEDGVEVLYANMTASQFMTFAAVIAEAEYEDGTPYIDFKLNDEKFIYFDSKHQVNMNALVSALLHDEKFTSESLKALCENGGEFLHADITAAAGYFADGSDLATGKLVISLTEAPAQLATVADLLNKAGDRFSFTAGNGYLDVDVKLPEEIYEAYIAYALMTGEISKDELAYTTLDAMNLVETYVSVLVDPAITTETYENTLAKLGVEKDLSSYAEVYSYLINFLNDETNYKFTPGEKTSEIYIGIENVDIDFVLGEMMNTSLEELAKGLVADEIVKLDAKINVISDVPTFKAVVVEPSLIKADGIANKINTIDFKQNGESFATSGDAAVMLVADINGDVTFNNSVILDLNGHSISGNVSTTNGTLLIVDSTQNTVSGAVVGSVSGNATVLAGAYNTSVEAYLPEGYYQDGEGVVKNALFTITDGNVVVDASVYATNVDGYLPAVKQLAADIAIDVILNHYFVGALHAEGKTGTMGELYDINFSDLIGTIGEGKGAIADELLDCVDMPALSAFINKIIADLLNVDKIAANLATGETIATYNFNLYPWTAEIYHETEGDYLTAKLQPTESNPEAFQLSLSVTVPTGKEITIPNTDRTVSVQDILDEMAAIVVCPDTMAEIHLAQPVRNGSELTVAGSAEAVVSLDFSHNDDYNRLLGYVLAYFDEDVKALYEDGCVIALNNAMSQVTVGQFFAAINNAIENEAVSFEEIADKLGQDLSEAELNKLSALYDKFLSGVAKIIAKFDLDENETAPLSDLMVDGEITVHGDIKEHSADATVKGVTLNVVVEEVDATLIIKLAEGEHKLVHVEGKAASCFEEGVKEHWYCETCLMVWEDEALTQLSNFKNVVIPATHQNVIHVEAKAATCIEDGNIEHWYCADCGTYWQDEAQMQLTNRFRVIIPANGSHTAGEAVKENDTGKYYDMVVYCSICNEELSRETVRRYLLGDVNMNDQVDFGDLTMITRKYMEDTTQDEFNYIQEELADVNRNGEFDFGDLTILTRYYMEDSTQAWTPIYIDIDVQ